MLFSFGVDIRLESKTTWIIYSPDHDHPWIKELIHIWCCILTVILVHKHWDSHLHLTYFFLSASILIYLLLMGYNWDVFGQTDRALPALGIFVAIHYQSVFDSEVPIKPTGTKLVDYRTDRLCAMLHCRDNNNNWWTARRCSRRTTDNHTDTTPTYQTWEYSCRRGRRIIRSPILLHPTFIIYLTLQLMFSPPIFFLYISTVEVISVL